MNLMTGKIVAKTPPIPRPDSSRGCFMFVWISSGDKIEKFTQSLSFGDEVDSLFITLAASEVGDNVEYSCSITNFGTPNEHKVLRSIKNIDKAFLF